MSTLCAHRMGLGLGNAFQSLRLGTTRQSLRQNCVSSIPHSSPLMRKRLLSTRMAPLLEKNSMLTNCRQIIEAKS